MSINIIKKRAITKEGKLNGVKTPYASSISKGDPKSKDQCHPTSTLNPIKNIMNKSKKESHPTSSSIIDSQRHNTLKAISQLTLNERTDLVSMCYSSKIHPK